MCITFRKRFWWWSPTFGSFFLWIHGMLKQQVSFCEFIDNERIAFSVTVKYPRELKDGLKLSLPDARIAKLNRKGKKFDATPCIRGGVPVFLSRIVLATSLGVMTFRRVFRSVTMSFFLYYGMWWHMIVG